MVECRSLRPRTSNPMMMTMSMMMPMTMMMTMPTTIMWCTGVEMTDALESEFRHRFNHRISERRPLGYPWLGHYGTWLIDSLQSIVERNHGVLLFPEWSNASDFRTTPERFGTVALHSEDLAVAMTAIDMQTPPKLTRDQKYLCDAMGTKLPLLPVHGKPKFSLFCRLMLQQETPKFDDKNIAFKWIKHVDGKEIFPKLPVYLRTHHKTWERNNRVRDAIKRAGPGNVALLALNAATFNASLDAAASITTAAIVAPPRTTNGCATAANFVANTATNATTYDAANAATANGAANCAMGGAVDISPLFAPIQLPRTMPRPRKICLRSVRAMR